MCVCVHAEGCLISLTQKLPKDRDLGSHASLSSEPGIQQASKSLWVWSGQVIARVLSSLLPQSASSCPLMVEGPLGEPGEGGGMKRKKDRRKRGGWREARTAGGGRLSLAFRKLSGVGCGTDIQKELEAKSASGGGNRSVQSPDARILGGSCIFLERLSRETHRRGPSFHF